MIFIDVLDYDYEEFPRNLKMGLSQEKSIIS